MFDPWVVLSNLSDPVTLLLMTLSACFGIIMGAVPGLSGTLGIALLLPFTFGLESATALLMLGSVYCGSEYGGSIPSILINTPGTAAALCTTFDGYPMAMKGQAQKALFTALISSVFGGIFGVSALLFLSVPLANVSMKFGAPEQFWLCVFALTIIASLSSGNVLKGVIGALIGLVLACVGMDPVTGYPRFTFNTMELMGGINVVPALIGLFAIPQALLLLRPAGEKGAMAPYNPAPGVFWQTLKDFFRRIWVTLVAGVIGVIVGIMPGAGGNIATFVAYNETKRFSKKPEEFGTGVMEGIMAPEVCNNAVVGGAQIPMLTLGIPGQRTRRRDARRADDPRPEAGLRSVLGAGRHRIHLYVRADPVELHHPAAWPRTGAYLRAGAENSAALSGCGDPGAVGGWFLLHQQLVDGRPVHGGLRLTRLRACAV